MGVRPPVRVNVPALGLEAKVVPVGVESNGELELPRTGRVAGWYRFGSEPGRPGTAVIAAHVDYAARRGVFYQLPTLEPVSSSGVSDRATRPASSSEASRYSASP